MKSKGTNLLSVAALAVAGAWLATRKKTTTGKASQGGGSQASGFQDPQVQEAAAFIVERSAELSAWTLAKVVALCEFVSLSVAGSPSPQRLLACYLAGPGIGSTAGLYLSPPRVAFGWTPAAWSQVAENGFADAAVPWFAVAAVAHRWGQVVGSADMADVDAAAKLAELTGGALSADKVAEKMGQAFELVEETDTTDLVADWYVSGGMSLDGTPATFDG